MTICIYLRPEPPIRELAESYASRLAQIVPASLTLGESALAHITLVHLEELDDREEEVWEAATTKLDTQYQVEGPFYLSAIPFPDGSGHNFIRIEVSRSGAVERAQQEMLRIAEGMGAKVSNLAGPAWRPHVTLAVVDRLPEQLPTFPEVVGGDPWAASPAIGTIGAYRHVDRLLHPR